MKLHHFLPFVMAGIAMTACSGNKTAESQTVVEETVVALDGNTLTLADGTQVIWLKDNPDNKLMPRDLFPQAPDSLIEQLGLQEGVPASISTFLMKADDEWVLFDTGLGAAHGGQLVNGLAALGLTPDSISSIYLTHFHSDHIGGLVQEGKPVFANAQVYAGEVEYKAWVEEMPAERNGQQREAIEAYKEQLHLFAFGDTLAHGIIALDAIGHTPGHTAFEKSDLIVIGDLMHGAALQLEHPEISGNYDMDKEEAAKSRARIINYAREKKLHMAGMHLPEPAFITK